MKIDKFDLMVALYVFGIMVAELMGAKTFPVATIGNFHLTASVAIFVMPLLFMSVDVIVEIYGRERARSLVRIGLLIVLLQILTAWLFTSLPVSKHYAPVKQAYNTIFGTSIRFGMASIAAFAASEFLDVTVFARIRQRMHGKALWLRTNISNFLSQFVDSTVFVVLAFYASSQSFSSNFSFLTGIIIPYYIVRVVMSIAETPLVYLAVGWFRAGKKKPGKLAAETAKA